MHRLVFSLVAASTLLVSIHAFADVAPDPCEGLKAGDACTTTNNKAGTCVEQNGLLGCVESPATTSSSGATSSSGSTTSTTTGTTTGGGDDGKATDDGCSASPWSASAWPGLVLVGLALGAFTAAGRTRRRRG